MISSQLTNNNVANNKVTKNNDKITNTNDINVINNVTNTNNNVINIIDIKQFFDNKKYTSLTGRPYLSFYFLQNFSVYGIITVFINRSSLALDKPMDFVLSEVLNDLFSKVFKAILQTPDPVPFVCKRNLKYQTTRQNKPFE